MPDSEKSDLVIVAGDLFANVHDVQAFAHGCNCQGSMGAGIAVTFRTRYPEMYEQYRALCKATPRGFNISSIRASHLVSWERGATSSRGWGRKK